jgi:uncharacterized protein YciI
MIRYAATLLLFGVLAVPALATDPPANMTTYYIGILMKGPRWTAEQTPYTTKIQEGHMAHLKTMWKAGKLVLAGPLEDDSDWQGVLIYRTKTLEEAQQLANDDPAVHVGRMVVTMHPWLVQRGILPDPMEGGAPPAGSK